MTHQHLGSYETDAASLNLQHVLKISFRLSPRARRVCHWNMRYNVPGGRLFKHTLTQVVEIRGPINCSAKSHRCLQLSEWRSFPAHYAGFPRSIEKVLNFKIGFQDLEKVLNLAKMYIGYWKSFEIPNRKEIWSIWAEFYWSQSNSLFMQRWAMCKIEFHD